MLAHKIEVLAAAVMDNSEARVGHLLKKMRGLPGCHQHRSSFAPAGRCIPVQPGVTWLLSDLSGIVVPCSKEVKPMSPNTQKVNTLHANCLCCLLLLLKHLSLHIGDVKCRVVSRDGCSGSKHE